MGRSGYKQLSLWAEIDPVTLETLPGMPAPGSRGPAPLGHPFTLVLMDGGSGFAKK